MLFTSVMAEKLNREEDLGPFFRLNYKRGS